MTTKKNPDLTRAKLLEAGFEQVYLHGFRAASLDQILESAGVTKGALYHHFPNKTALGYALVEEVIGEFMVERLLTPLRDTNDPITALKRHGAEMLEKHCDEACSCGCPLNNLAQEMSREDEGFRERIAAVFARLEKGVADALRRGQEAGTVRSDIDPVQIASFFMAVASGIMGAAKNTQSVDVMGQNMAAFGDYLESLRALPVH